MTRLVAIAAFIALSVFLFRYRTNKNVQQGVTIAFLCGLAIYTILIVISELSR
ncbi:hypothetical protein [Vibrio sp. SCSIO 43137]|uniref:hypothetical protein n=1 Tax=Vibrio sp. SCSIO 43137 TaxID=3021011 RepID=UPI0023078D6C|nr:hypothetical protein [Vibrio sp. SCSIO 43137]WCE31175.1 hypothetical protein PK654_07885 [Vibrio sp. SCSIO 43137]